MYVLKLIKFQKLTLYSLFSVSLYFLLGFKSLSMELLTEKTVEKTFWGPITAQVTISKSLLQLIKSELFMLFESGLSHVNSLCNKISTLSNRVDTIWIVLVIGSSIKKIDNPVLQMFPLVLRPVTFFLMKRFDLTLFHYQKMKTELWLNLLILCTVIKCSLSFKSLVPFISFMSPNLLLKHS